MQTIFINIIGGANSSEQRNTRDMLCSRVCRALLPKPPRLGVNRRYFSFSLLACLARCS